MHWYFCWKKMWVNGKATHIFFSKTYKCINEFAIFQDRNFNVTLAYNFVKVLTTGTWTFIRHYENMPIQIYWKVNHWNIENFQTKNSNIFHISAQNIDCGYSLEPSRRGGSNEYPESMFLSRNKKNNVYPCKPQFYYIKVGFKGVKII